MSTPEDEYLQLLGKFVYDASGLEGLVLFDLWGVDPEFNVAPLLGSTMTSIGNAVGKQAEKWEGDLRSFGLLAADALRDVGEDRNDVLHSRPATAEGGAQRLYRYRWLDGELVNFFVTPEALETAIVNIRQWRDRLEPLRPRRSD